MKTSRAQFKYALRLCRQQESMHKSNALANSLLHRDTKQFWKTIKQTERVESAPLADTVGGCSGLQQVADMWKQHYEKLLNTHQPKSFSSDSLQQSETERLEVCDVANAISKLKSGKSAGHDGIKAEHFKFSHQSCHVLLNILFNCVLIHGYLPREFMSTVIMPLVKDKKGDISDVDNYRPIAITTVISKIFEHIILEKYQDLLYTSHNQFGFKSGHSTEQCIFTLKQVIDFYTVNSSPIYLCFMDLSKAFDMVNHEKLFTVLYKRGFHYVFIRLIRFWYSTQLFVIKWGPAFSEPFSTTNGTRQGSVLSPYLFNVYIDELSDRLKSTGIGCNLNNVCFNHLCYADDSVLIATSPRALQVLMDVSFQFSFDFHLKYNLKKTKCLYVPSSFRKNLTSPPFYLNGSLVKNVFSQSYLGNFINSEMCEDDSVENVMKSIYTRGNYD